MLDKGKPYCNKNWLDNHYLAKMPFRDRNILTLPLKRGETVLDIGSGPGYYSDLLARLVGDSGNVVAVDINQNHIDYIKNRNSDSLFKDIIRPKVSSILNTKNLGLFDVIFCANTLCYFKDYESILEGLIAMLKPGGRLIVRESDMGNCIIHPIDNSIFEKIKVMAQKSTNSKSDIKIMNFFGRRVVGSLLKLCPNELEIAPCTITFTNNLSDSQKSYLIGLSKILIEETQDTLLYNELEDWYNYFDQENNSYILDREDFFFSMTEYNFISHF